MRLILLVLFAFCSFMGHLGAYDGKKITTEIVVSVSLNEIVFSEGNMFIEHEGSLLPVHSLTKDEEAWLVRASLADWYKCPEGHMRACPICGGCAYMECWYYCDGYCC
ncbi:MAG: hypothetical protein K0U13_03055 [Chlamydiae bacterium]|nr:hypothetical protein [Chlamydiales bacterium]MCH9703747.1 hypothetical protein [Chlamydiota bacterium]